MDSSVQLINLIYLILGAALACGLVTIGIAMGYLRGRTKGVQTTEELDRQGLLEMVRQLGSWTTEYSGNVSAYQNRIGELTELARRSGGQTPDKMDNHVAILLNEIMQSNATLQTRLEVAENQLDKQTRQIESYLTEARTDGLTKLANRRAFDDKIEELFASYRKGGKSFVLAMIDIDHFKKINDTMGHQAGDEVLRQIAAILRQSMEHAYVIARYGGEEFVILMAGPVRLAADRIDAMRRRIAAEPLRVGDRSVPITISAGLTEPRDEVVTGSMIRRADECLYAAKNIGRNRVYYHDGRQSMLVGAPELATRL